MLSNKKFSTLIADDDEAYEHRERFATEHLQGGDELASYQNIQVWKSLLCG